MGEEEKNVLDAYVDGINDYAKSLYLLPIEFLILNTKFDKWTVKDSLMIGSFFSFQISPQWASTIIRTNLTKTFGFEFAKKIMPFEDGYNGLSRSYTIISEDQVRKLGLYTQNIKANTEKFEERFKTVKPLQIKKEEPQKEGFGVKIGGGNSNAWVVHGNYTKSGKPILAGDPHIQSTIPSMFYNAKMKFNDYTVLGCTVPGLPIVVFGRNDYFSWSLTSSLIENMDIYSLKINENKTKYFHDGIWKDLKIKTNSIKVKGASDVIYETYQTHHGAVLFPVNKNYAAALPDP